MSHGRDHSSSAAKPAQNASGSRAAVVVDAGIADDGVLAPLVGRRKAAIFTKESGNFGHGQSGMPAETSIRVRTAAARDAYCGAGALEELPITIDGGSASRCLIVQLTQIVMRGGIARLDRERAQKSWQPEAGS